MDLETGCLYLWGSLLFSSRWEFESRVSVVSTYGSVEYFCVIRNSKGKSSIPITRLQ